MVSVVYPGVETDLTGDYLRWVRVWQEKDLKCLQKLTIKWNKSILWCCHAVQATNQPEKSWAKEGTAPFSVFKHFPNKLIGRCNYRLAIRVAFFFYHSES